MIHDKFNKLISPKYRNNIIVAFLLAILGFFSVLYTLQVRATGSSAPSKRFNIILQSKGFNPSEITISQGDTITFTTNTGYSFWPASDLHPTHLIYPEFDPKAPITPNKSWSFVFDKIGSWRFHDHLNPNFTGLITVTGKTSKTSSKPELIVEDCSKKSDIGSKQKCWDEQLLNTLKVKGLDEAFNLFVKLYDSEPSVPKSCHGWTHILGKAAFDIYKQSRSLILRKEVSYCGYGFFHGFMERLLQTTGNLNEATDFCKYASQQLGQNARGTSANCVHGIGHGSVDVDNTLLWGNFQRLADSGTKRCESIFVDAGELGLCLDGVFNAMSQLELLSENGLRLDNDDIYSDCRKQQDRYKNSCYTQFTGVMDEQTTLDFKRASGIIQREHLATEIGASVYSKLAADIIQYDIVNKSQTDNVKNCRLLPSVLYDACIHGLSTGFISHGEPGKEYVKALEFCGSSDLNQYEKNICYQPILQQLVPQGFPVCQQVAEQYRQYCY